MLWPRLISDAKLESPLRATAPRLTEAGLVEPGT
jgi:hypothetical protein